jgi:hypothetical protein
MRPRWRGGPVAPNRSAVRFKTVRDHRVMVQVVLIGARLRTVPFTPEGVKAALTAHLR